MVRSFSGNSILSSEFWLFASKSFIWELSFLSGEGGVAVPWNSICCGFWWRLPFEKCAGPLRRAVLFWISFRVGAFDLEVFRAIGTLAIWSWYLRADWAYIALVSANARCTLDCESAGERYLEFDLGFLMMDLNIRFGTPLTPITFFTFLIASLVVLRTPTEESNLTSASWCRWLSCWPNYLCIPTEDWCLALRAFSGFRIPGPGTEGFLEPCCVGCDCFRLCAFILFLRLF